MRKTVELVRVLRRKGGGRKHLSGVDHESVGELHRLGTGGAQFARDDNLASLGARLHDEAEDTVARAGEKGVEVSCGFVGTWVLPPAASPPPSFDTPRTRIVSPLVVTPSPPLQQASWPPLKIRPSLPATRNEGLTDGRQDHREACTSSSRTGRQHRVHGSGPSQRRARRSPRGT